MGRHRLNKKDRVAMAGKKNSHAIYVQGTPKQKWVEKK